jgi:hypothetical protein
LQLQSGYRADNRQGDCSPWLPHNAIPKSAVSIEIQTIAPCHDFEFAAHGVRDWNDRSRLKFEGRKHRAELVHGDRIIAVGQHIATPIPNTDQEQFDLEVGGAFPLAKYIKYPLLRFFIFDG